jgi:hypothetical protein
MVNQWGKEGEWLVHCHSGPKSRESVKPADEVPFAPLVCLVHNLSNLFEQKEIRVEPLCRRSLSILARYG